jgi:hypothetical protein
MARAISMLHDADTRTALSCIRHARVPWRWLGKNLAELTAILAVCAFAGGSLKAIILLVAEYVLQAPRF